MKTYYWLFLIPVVLFTLKIVLLIRKNTANELAYESNITYYQKEVNYLSRHLKINNYSRDFYWDPLLIDANGNKFSFSEISNKDFRVYYFKKDDCTGCLDYLVDMLNKDLQSNDTIQKVVVCSNFEPLELFLFLKSRNIEIQGYILDEPNWALFKDIAIHSPLIVNARNGMIYDLLFVDSQHENLMKIIIE